MSEPRIMLATLCLNEMEWLPLLYEQHKSWPGLVSWVFVEGADAAYASANPHMVSDGFSVDGTSEYLEGLLRTNSKAWYIPHGLFSHASPDLGKAVARSRYLEHADEVRPDYIVILDADEMYTHAHQLLLNNVVRRDPNSQGWAFHQREIWRPPSIADHSLLSWEVIEGLWRMTHCHCWRWNRGMRYINSHIYPSLPNGHTLNCEMARLEYVPGMPQYVHLGWASQARTRLAKTRYYTARGEGQGDGRAKWMECRRAWEGWSPSDSLLPHGARVVPYTGPIPECLAKEVPPR